MPRKLYVANLCHMVERAELEKLFAGHGTVRLAEIIEQLQIPDSTGKGLVEMDSEEQGEAAITALNGMQHRGFALMVGWDEPPRRDVVPPAPMFESMNIPDENTVPSEHAPHGVAKTKEWIGMGSDSADPLSAHADHATHDAGEGNLPTEESALQL